MIVVLIQDEAGEPIGEMRIEDVSPFSTHGIKDYSVKYAADSGGGWVDVKQRVLYGFNFRKYNVLALVSEALNLLDLSDMEMTDADHPGRMARGQRGAWQEILGEADDPVHHHRPALRSGQSEQQLGDSGRQEDGAEDRE